MPPFDYIFIDWENVSEFEPTRIVGKRARVFMILGAMQAHLPVSLVLFLQSHPEQLKIIQSSVVGRNALDFVLSCELGQALAADPEGSFHIVSKDKDFKSIVTHLQGAGRLIARHRSISEIPSLLTAEERVASLRAALENPAVERPVTRHGLEETIRGRFLHQADEILVGRVVAYLIAENVLRITAAEYVVYPAG
jgi:hypothetical protein